MDLRLKHLLYKQLEVLERDKDWVRDYELIKIKEGIMPATYFSGEKIRYGDFILEAYLCKKFKLAFMKDPFSLFIEMITISENEIDLYSDNYSLAKDKHNYAFYPSIIKNE
jgi:hypothetical protein